MFYNDTTAYNAINIIEKPPKNIEDWNQEDNLEEQGTTKLLISRAIPNKPERDSLLIQDIFRERAELLISRRIDRKTLTEWEDKKLFTKGVKKSNHKLYHEKALYELHASWLLVNGPQPESGNCSYSEAGKIRMKVIEAQNNGTIQDLRTLGTIAIDENGNPDYANIHATDNIDRTKLLSYFWVRYRALSQKGVNPISLERIITTIDTLNAGII